MVGFVLAFRIILEIPTCQAVGTWSTCAAGSFPQLIPYSKFAVDLSNDGLKLTEPQKFGGVQKAFKRVPEEYKGQRSLELGAKAIHLENAVWAAANCKNSNWRRHAIAYYLTPQDWLVPVATLKNVDELGGVGSANLVAFNYMFFQRLKSVLLREDTERAIRPWLEKMLAKKSTWTAALSRWWQWERIVERASEHASDMFVIKAGRISVTSQRPWTVGSDTLHFELNDGWKIRLWQSFTLLLLLLVAILPIRKKILHVCQTTAPLPMALVTLHTSLDTVSLVTTWLLCAMAPAAFFIGQCLERVFEQYQPFAVQTVMGMEYLRADAIYAHASRLLWGYTMEHGGQIMDLIYETILPALAWNPIFVLSRVACTLAFFVISALLSRLLCAQRFATCISVGICGPLWLFTEEGEKDDTYESTAQGVCLLIIFRNFLLAAIVFFTWISVDSNSIQMFLALICNRVLDVLPLKLYCLALFAGNGLTGLLATLATHDLRKNRKDGLCAQPAHVFLASSHGSAYGTFEARSEPSLSVWAELQRRT